MWRGTSISRTERNAGEMRGGVKGIEEQEHGGERTFNEKERKK
jgi:hypothetical protein